MFLNGPKIMEAIPDIGHDVHNTHMYITRVSTTILGLSQPTYLL